MDEGKEKSVKKERTKAPSGWKCVPCHGRYTDREEYITHMAEQHGKVGPPYADCQQKDHGDGDLSVLSLVTILDPGSSFFYRLPPLHPQTACS